MDGDIVFDTVRDPHEHGVVCPSVESGSREHPIHGHDGLARTQPRRILHYHLPIRGINTYQYTGYRPCKQVLQRNTSFHCVITYIECVVPNSALDHSRSDARNENKDLKPRVHLLQYEIFLA